MVRKIFYVTFILAVTISANGERVTRDLLVLYDFTEESGDVVHDRQDPAPHLDLGIPDSSKVEWLNPGLRVKEATVLLTTSQLTKLNVDTFFNKGITIEVWIKPLNNTQGGPARIVTYSQDSANRNFTLGQTDQYYEQRFRTSQNPGNGNNPALKTTSQGIQATPSLQHVVYTRSESGAATFYIDKKMVNSVSVPGDGSNWSTAYDFGLFNEINYPTDTRTWLGDIFLVAIYGDDLNLAEVSQNFDFGPPIAEGKRSVDVAWDANTEDDLEGYKIYYGVTSRFGPIDPVPIIAGVVADKCGTPGSTMFDECKEAWEKYCSCVKWEDYDKQENCLEEPESPDPLCTYQFFPYDRIIDVKNVTEYTIQGLDKENKYFIAATAYDASENESKFSDELTLDPVDSTSPSPPSDVTIK